MITPSINSVDNRFRNTNLPALLTPAVVSELDKDKIELARSKNHMTESASNNPFMLGLGAARSTNDPYSIESPIGITHVKISALDALIPITIPSGEATVMAVGLSCNACGNQMTYVSGRRPYYVCDTQECPRESIAVYV